MRRTETRSPVLISRARSMTPERAPKLATISPLAARPELPCYATADRRLRPDRRRPHRCPGGARWIHRLALRAALRRAGLLRGTAGRPRARTLANRAGCTGAAHP